VTTTVRLLAIAGDGIGRELMPPTVRLLHALAPLDVEVREAGHAVWQERGRAFDDELIPAARAADGVLFGCTATPSPPPPGYVSPILALREQLGLAVNLRHCRAGDGGPLDVLIVRECSEGLYAHAERSCEDGMVADYVVTETATRRVAHAAADAAAARGGRVTVAHKANVLPETDGLFRAIALSTLRERGVEADDALADAAAYHLVANPGRYDVLLTNSHVGDILSDVAAAVAGGLGLVPSISLGPGGLLAEPIHGAAPDIVGSGTADPTGLLLSAGLLLRRLGLDATAERLESAVVEHVRAREPGRPVDTAAAFDDVERGLALAESTAGRA